MSQALKKYCKHCNLEKIELYKEPTYPGQSAPTLCNECFDIAYPNFSDLYRRVTNRRFRNRRDGECFKCSRIKVELREDPDNPNKPIWIWCDECYEESFRKARENPYAY